MKTLVNKVNPAIRITAPEITTEVAPFGNYQYVYWIPVINEMYNPIDWTLIEEEPVDLEREAVTFCFDNGINITNMTQEEKQLLLKDLSARLPYGVKVQCDKYLHPVTILYAGNINEVKFAETGGIEHINSIKPYLRPMSSMTEEERKEYNKTRAKIAVQWDDYGTPIGYEYAYTIKTFDWLNKHHFDFRNLIEKGLALEAKEDMYTKTKEE